MRHLQSQGQFLAGNSTPTIPHRYSQHKRSGFPAGTCDTAAADGKCGSNVYEVNQWLWQFGRGKQRLGGLSVEKTDDRKEAVLKEQSLHRAETCQHSKPEADQSQALLKVKCGCEAVQTCLYYIHTYIYIYTHVCTRYIQIY